MGLRVWGLGFVSRVLGLWVMGIWFRAMGLGI